MDNYYGTVLFVMVGFSGRFSLSLNLLANFKTYNDTK